MNAIEINQSQTFTLFEENNLNEEDQYEFSFEKDYTSYNTVDKKEEPNQDIMSIHEFLNEEDSDLMSLISTCPKPECLIKETSFILEKEREKAKALEKEAKPTILLQKKLESKNNLAESSQDYSVLVDCLLHKNFKTHKSLPKRKDVVNKKILRGFKKYICTLFAGLDKRPCRAKNSIEILKGNLIEAAIKIGIISREEQGNTDLTEFVCWMAMTKITKVTKSIFDYDNKAIQLLDDILSKYSHIKLENVCENPIVKRLFQFFLNRCSDKFIKSIPEDTQDVYIDGLQALSHQFKIVL